MFKITTMFFAVLLHMTSLYAQSGNKINTEPYLLLNDLRYNIIIKTQLYASGITVTSNFTIPHHTPDNPWDYSIYFSGVGFPYVMIVPGKFGVKLDIPDDVKKKISIGTEMTIASGSFPGAKASKDTSIAMTYMVTAD